MLTVLTRSVEYHGQVCIYFDVEGRQPPYELKRFETIDSGAMVYHGSHSQIINMHLQEFAENSVDYMHFQVRFVATIILMIFSCNWANKHDVLATARQDEDPVDGHLHSDGDHPPLSKMGS